MQEIQYTREELKRMYTKEQLAEMDRLMKGTKDWNDLVESPPKVRGVVESNRRTRLTGSPTGEEVDAAMNNPLNKTVSFHREGSIVEMSDGTKYVVRKDGSWQRISRIRGD